LPLVARAQQLEHVRRIGVLSNLASDDQESQTRNAAFLQPLIFASRHRQKEDQKDTKEEQHEDKKSSPPSKHEAESEKAGPNDMEL
jgi:hypothetical protein